MKFELVALIRPIADTDEGKSVITITVYEACNQYEARRRALEKIWGCGYWVVRFDRITLNA